MKRIPIILLFLLAACQPAPADAPKPAALAKDQVRLVLYRPSSFKLGMRDAPLEVNGTTYTLENGAISWVDAPPGPLTVHLNGWDSDAARLTMKLPKPGRYYLRVGTSEPASRRDDIIQRESVPKEHSDIFFQWFRMDPVSHTLAVEEMGKEIDAY